MPPPLPARTPVGFAKVSKGGEVYGGSPQGGAACGAAGSYDLLSGPSLVGSARPALTSRKVSEERSMLMRPGTFWA